MNLKESFRYQKFLDQMLRSACVSIIDRNHGVTATKAHRRSEVNPDAEDIVEEVKCKEAFFPDDDVVRFAVYVIGEKQKLSVAIGKAKAGVGFDVDAAIETNKCRQRLSAAIEEMLTFSACERVEQGFGYKFNAEGNQTKYFYDICVAEQEAFNRKAAKLTRRDMISDSDQVSERIDQAMVNTQVDYTPPYDVNDTFEDVMEVFIGKER